MRETLVKSEEFKDSPIGRIPKDWEVTCIGDLGTWRGGSTPSKSLASNWSDGEIVWVSPKDFRGTEITDSEDKITKQAVTNHNITLFEPGNVLAVFRSSILRHTFPVAIGQVPFTVNQDVKVLSPRDNVNHRFAFFVLQFLGSEILRAAAKVGTTVESIDYPTFCNLPIYLPPIKEQEGIVEIIDTLDKAIAHTSSLIAKLKQMKAGLLHDLLTRGLDENGELRDAIGHPEQFKPSPLERIPKDWLVVSVGECLARIEQGWSPDCESNSTPLGEWGVLKTTAVVWEGYQDFENKQLPSHLQPDPNYEVKPEDVLMTRAGPNSRVGVVALVRQTQGKLMLSDKLYRLIPRDCIKPDFLAYTLSGSRTQRHLSTLKTGLAESQTNISQEIVRTLLIALPAIQEQERIISILDTHDTRIRTEEAYRNKLQLQKQGLMHDLLTGQVRVNSAKPVKEDTSQLAALTKA